MTRLKFLGLCAPALMLAACASTPMGPTVLALPAQGKSFDQFQMDQMTCKSYADQQVQGQADRANSTGLLEGVGGTILGAGLGAAIGGGHGAAIGAAGGALAGTAVGASTSGHEQKSIQQQYNDAYTQCMVAKGNRVEARRAPPPRTVVYTQPAPPPTVVYVQQPPPPPTVIYEQPAHPDIYPGQ